MDYTTLLAGLRNLYPDASAMLEFCQRAGVDLGGGLAFKLMASYVPSQTPPASGWERIFEGITDPIERQKLLDRARIEHFAVFREAAPVATLDDVCALVAPLRESGVTFRYPYFARRGAEVRGVHLCGTVGRKTIVWEVTLPAPLPLDRVLSNLDAAGIPVQGD